MSSLTVPRVYGPKALHPKLIICSFRLQVRHAAERQREGLQRRLATSEAALRAAEGSLGESQHERQVRYLLSANNDS